MDIVKRAAERGAVEEGLGAGRLDYGRHGSLAEPRHVSGMHPAARVELGRWAPSGRHFLFERADRAIEQQLGDFRVGRSVGDAKVRGDVLDLLGVGERIDPRARAGLEGGYGSRSFAARYRQRYASIRGAIEGVVREGQSSGEFRTELEPATEADTLCALFDGLAVTSATSAGSLAMR